MMDPQEQNFGKLRGSKIKMQKLCRTNGKGNKNLKEVQKIVKST